MSANYKNFFGFKREPFSPDIQTKDLLMLPGMIGVKERLDYCLELGGVMIITGEVGSGKSTSLRYCCSKLHPSEVLSLEILGNTGSVAELYKSICWELGINILTSGKSKLIREVKSAIQDIVKSKKQKMLLLIDESHLIRADVFAELHLLTQFEHDSKNLLTLVLCGQTALLDRLHYRGSAPLASRIIARTHLETLNEGQMEEYINHHIAVAGIKKRIYDKTAITAIFQGSGGLLRKTNALARGGLIAATIEQSEVITAEHIRIAASELF